MKYGWLLPKIISSTWTCRKWTAVLHWREAHCQCPSLLVSAGQIHLLSCVSLRCTDNLLILSEPPLVDPPLGWQIPPKTTENLLFSIQTKQCWDSHARTNTHTHVLTRSEPLARNLWGHLQQILTRRCKYQYNGFCEIVHFINTQGTFCQ